MQIYYTMQNWFVHPQIELAETIDPKFYNNTQVWENSKSKIFSRSWNHIGDKNVLFSGNTNAYPIDLLPKYLGEPILLLKKEDQIQCFPNICTHRGFKLIQHPGTHRKLTCNYHGRRFNFEGNVEFMPEFKEVENFPRPCDHLQEISLSQWNNQLFSSMNPEIPFDIIKKGLDKYLYFLDFKSFIHQPEINTEYTINCHWALYIENYLEGFHIPFVHNDLGALLDYGNYVTEVDDHIVTQIGFADKGSPTFDFPEDHPHFGKEITAYYLWFYPNFMLNVYPWGVQYNIVKPLTPEITKVNFVYYVKDQAIFDQMDALNLAEKTEREDEFVVEEVHKGMKSRFFNKGRFSVKREKGVHYFQRLLCEYLNN